jgi:peptide/nickel transport system ATP-binding protein
MRVADTVAEPIRAHRILDDPKDIRQRVEELLGQCGLPHDAARRFPYAFSGGQRQRIGIARALGVGPKLIVADEPVSALDVSVQAQIIFLLKGLQEETGISYLFIAHNLAVVASIAHRVAIMYLGRIVETGSARRVLTDPYHPYTQALLSAVPLPDVALQRRRQRIVVAGEPPNPINPPSGCHFHVRCPLATERCKHEAPPLDERSGGHLAACWNV